jgi:hypothetical protein
MLNDTADVSAEAAETEAKASPAAPEKKQKDKPKPAPKPKPAATSGPVFLLLQANGKYKELKESELTAEAASVLKDPSLRLVKAQPMIPEISFKLAED